MSYFKTVFEYLDHVPKGVLHSQAYDDFVRNKSKSVTGTSLSLAEVEYSSMGLFEKNVLCGMSMSEKFTLRDMHKNIPIKIFSLAKGGNASGVSSLKHKEVENFTFTSEYEIDLWSNGLGAVYPKGNGLRYNKDRLVKEKIMSSCSTLGPKEMHGLNSALVGEALGSGWDMKHMLLKGYLMLMDYNLAVCSKLKTRMEGNVTKRCRSNVGAGERLAAIVQHKVVVDTLGFSPRELKYICMMGSSYPCVKYAGDNIYNMLGMEEDDLIVVSNKEVVIEGGFDFGSPDEMYHLLVNIAAKMGCVEDLFSVIKDFRGLPGLFKDIAEMCGKNGHVLKFSKSRSYIRSLDIPYDGYDRVTRESNYYSTTKNLVVDIFITEGYKCALYSCLENMGVVGKVGCPTGVPSTDPVTNSHMRDYGLKHERELVNIALQALRGCNDGVFPIALEGSMKTYLISMCNKVWKGERTIIPQFFFEIPYLKHVHTAWGVTKGWNADYNILGDGFDNVVASLNMQAFLWCMGVTKKYPKLGVNAIGVPDCELANSAEYDFVLGAEGTYSPVNMQYSVGCDVSSRTDAFEKTAMWLHSTRFKGTKCGLINERGRVKMVAPSIDIDTKETLAPDVPTKMTITDEDEGGVFKKKDSITVSSSPSKQYNGIKPVVSGHDGPKLKVSSEMRHVLKSTGGKWKGESLTGEEIVGLFEPVTGVLSPGVKKMMLIKTTGDGQCGVHAVVQDLAAHGLVDPSKVDEWKIKVKGQLQDSSFHDVQDLALVMNQFGIGLRVYQKDDTGWRATQYGRSDTHNVSLYHDDNHYSTVIEGAGDDVEIKRCDPGVGIEASIQNLRQWQSIFTDVGRRRT